MIPDCIAVVTGAGGSGCGRAIARRFAKDGAAVVASDINENGGHETVRLIEDAGGRAVFFRADVRDERQVRDLIAFAEQSYGGVSVLVNNASGPFRPGDETEHGQIQRRLSFSAPCMPRGTGLRPCAARAEESL